MNRSRARICLVALLVACNGPFVVFPGGALDGPVKPVPDSFEFARDAGTVQLETNPEDPYSVNIACAVADGKLFVSAGNSKAQWVEHMEADPRVRMRIKDTIYEFAARRVSDAQEMDAFAEEWTKNAWARDPRSLEGDVWVYRLEPR